MTRPRAGRARATPRRGGCEVIAGARWRSARRRSCSRSAPACSAARAGWRCRAPCRSSCGCSCSRRMSRSSWRTRRRLRSRATRAQRRARDRARAVAARRRAARRARGRGPRRARPTRGRRLREARCPTTAPLAPALRRDGHERARRQAAWRRGRGGGSCSSPRAGVQRRAARDPAAGRRVARHAAAAIPFIDLRAERVLRGAPLRLVDRALPVASA